MEKFNLSNETMQKLESLRNSLNCGKTVSSLNGNPTACTTCWGGSCCTNPITG